MRGREETRWHRRLPVHPLILTTAALWLLFTVLALASIQPAAASSRQAPNPNIAATPLLTVTILPTNTPTTTAPTATPAGTATTAPTGTVPPKKTPTATATVPSSNGGGGSGNGGDGGNGPTSAGPDVTRVVFSQPTVAAGNDSAVPGLGGATFGSNGLLLATTMSCMVGLLGLTVAGIALMVLVRRGYGPFLRALVRGKRAGQHRGKQGADGTDGLDGFGGGYESQYLPGAASSWRGGPAAGTAYRANQSTPRGQYQSAPYARNGQGGAARSPVQSPRSRSQRQPPATRSRADWR